MPPCEGRSKKMKHQVYKNIQCLLDLDKFLGSVLKYNKKFYKLTLIGGENTPYRIQVHAVGISRDLIYKIYWVMDASTFDEEYTYNDIFRGDAPIYGWVPKHKEDLAKLYPNAGVVPNAPGEHYWISIFESWGFIRVDGIKVID